MEDDLLGDLLGSDDDFDTADTDLPTSSYVPRKERLRVNASVMRVMVSSFGVWNSSVYPLFFLIGRVLLALFNLQIEQEAKKKQEAEVERRLQEERQKKAAAAAKKRANLNTIASTPGKTVADSLDADLFGLGGGADNAAATRRKIAAAAKGT